jgi:hypothetical protein
MPSSARSSVMPTRVGAGRGSIVFEHWAQSGFAKTDLEFESTRAALRYGYASTREWLRHDG